MTKQLKWRLGKLPTPDEVLKLVNDKLITKEEARDILFNEESDERDEESLKEEIVFLRKLVDKLSEGKTTVIKEYIHSYPSYTWTTPYLYCTTNSSNGGGTYTVGNSTGSATLTGTVSNTMYLSEGSMSGNFSDIQNF